MMGSELKVLCLGIRIRGHGLIFEFRGSLQQIIAAKASVQLGFGHIIFNFRRWFVGFNGIIKVVHLSLGYKGSK